MYGGYMKVIVKEPGKDPEGRWIRNDLKELQAAVDGYIETVTPWNETWTIVCNEEGRLRGLPENCSVMGIDFFGTILFVGTKGDEFDDCPLTETDVKALIEPFGKEF